jgi:hypothetical protein
MSKNVVVQFRPFSFGQIGLPKIKWHRALTWSSHDCENPGLAGLKYHQECSYDSKTGL